MREITSHKVNGLNEALKISVIDEPGSGGANHAYNIFVDGKSPDEFDTVKIRFQKGPIKEAGVNGISGEALLAIVRDRLECFQKGPYASRHNEEALMQVVGAMETLHRRTKQRIAKGIEGTSVVDAADPNAPTGDVNPPTVKGEPGHA